MKVLSMLLILMLFCFPVVGATDYTYLGDEVTFSADYDASLPATLFQSDQMTQPVCLTMGFETKQATIQPIEAAVTNDDMRTSMPNSLSQYNLEVQCVSRAEHSAFSTQSLISNTDENTKGATLQSGLPALIRRE